MTEDNFTRAAEIKNQIDRINYDLNTGFLEKAPVRELVDRWLTEEDKEMIRKSIIHIAKEKRDELQKEFDQL